MKGLVCFSKPTELVAPRSITVLPIVRVEAACGVVYQRLVEFLVIIVKLRLGSFEVDRKVVLWRASSLVINKLIRLILLLKLMK